MSDSASCAATMEQVATSASDEFSPVWPAVVSLSLGVFGLVTAEFLPASLLTPMAKDLAISDGSAGQAVTATAIVGAIAAPLMAILTRGIDRRTVLWAFSVLLIVSNIIAATASGLAMLLIARIMLGVALGGFWSMSAAMVMRLVPMRLVPRGMSLMMTGVSVATVTAAPVGAYIGELWGWRTAFFTAAGVGLLALLVQMLTLPKLPALGAANLRTLFDLLKRPSLSVAVLTVLLAISGHFAGFTYVRPFLEQVPHLSIEAIALTLLAYGIGGFFGNFAGAFLVERSLKANMVLGILFISLMALVLILFGSAQGIAAAAVAFWGFAFGLLPVGFQSWIIRAAPDEAESAGGLLVATFQVAIASGAILGGVLVDNAGATGAVGFSAIATLLGAALVFAATGKAAAPER
ncbi:MFS transporter [Taklimakanibacter deserti]|uniref:MFS transporter n=1 Tax=Taklimakanibacter deserti TaxID=2267839 RepID=UPI000E647284